MVLKSRWPVGVVLVAALAGLALAVFAWPARPADDARIECAGHICFPGGFPPPLRLPGHGAEPPPEAVGDLAGIVFSGTDHTSRQR